jgi:WD40 repeat protein
VTGTSSELLGWDLSVTPAASIWRVPMKLPPTGNGYCPFQLTADKQLLAVRSAQGTKSGIQLFDLTAIPPTPLAWMPQENITTYALSHDGRYLAYGGNFGLKLAQPARSLLTQLYAKQIKGDVVRWPAFHPSGGFLALCNDNGRVEVRRTVDGEVVLGWTFPGLVGWVEFADDGRHLFTHNSNGTVYVLRLNDLDKLAAASP